jgi:GNAT superfamily N-acetyltransferase
VGLTPVPDDHVAAIVTHLEMRERPALKPLPLSRLHLVRWPQPELGKYRTLFSRVGTPWLWFSRAVMADTAVAAIIGNPLVEVYAVADPSGIEVGLVELDFRVAGECEIAYFGLIVELTGGGHGRWLMAQTLALGWRKDVTRIWVHTCTLDHPKALNFYRAQGFEAFKREVETFPDPRMTGHLPRNAAPQVPLLGASVS